MEFWGWKTVQDEEHPDVKGQLILQFWGWRLKKQNSHLVFSLVFRTSSPNRPEDTSTLQLLHRERDPVWFQAAFLIEAERGEARDLELWGWTIWRRPELFNTLVRQTKLQKSSLAEKGRNQSRLPLWSRVLTFDLLVAGFPTRVSART